MEDHQGTVTEKERGTNLRAETPVWFNLQTLQVFGGQKLQGNEHSCVQARRCGDPESFPGLLYHRISASLFEAVPI